MRVAAAAAMPPSAFALMSCAPPLITRLPMRRHAARERLSRHHAAAAAVRAMSRARLYRVDAAAVFNAIAGALKIVRAGI